MANTQQIKQLVQRLDPQGKLIKVWQLDGGVSSHMTAFEFVRSDGQEQKLIARRPNDGVLAHNPQAVADEFKLLQILQAEGIPVPSPCYLDQAGDILGKPLLVTEYIEGETEFSPIHLDDFISQQAIQLAHIHQIGKTRGKQWDLSFLPKAEDIYGRRLQSQPAKMNDELLEGRVRAILEAAWPVAQVNESVLLHGDFWLGNILWDAGRLTAVIDWEDAAYGDPLADLAITRLEMLWMFDLQTMQNFMAKYQSLTDIDYSNQPYWDLCTVLRWCFRYIGDWVEEENEKQAIRDKQLLFFQQALDQLSIPYHD